MGFVKDCKCNWCTNQRPWPEIKSTPITDAETIELADYKVRLTKGILHSATYRNRMQNLQDRFDQHRDCRT